MKTQTIKDKLPTFDQLSIEEKRIAIAKDVIERLALEEFVPAYGTYLAMRYVDNDGYVNNMSINTPNTLCACALGSMAYAYLNGQAIDRGDLWLRDQLSAVFERDQLHLIEAAFEGWLSEKDSDEPISFFRPPPIALRRSYAYRLFRMKAIMENIISNNGTFVPKKFNALVSSNY